MFQSECGGEAAGGHAEVIRSRDLQQIIIAGREGSRQRIIYAESELDDRPSFEANCPRGKRCPSLTEEAKVRGRVTHFECKFHWITHDSCDRHTCRNKVINTDFVDCRLHCDSGKTTNSVRRIESLALCTGTRRCNYPRPSFPHPPT